MPDDALMEMRFNPLLGQWVLVSSGRKKRPWQPKHFCPFCPGSEEMGTGWDTKYVLNKYPMMRRDAPRPKRRKFFVAAPSIGENLVLVETPEHDLEDLHAIPQEQMEKVVRMMVEITKKYMREPWANYVYIFRNKGREIGVSLLHPHGQTYVTPFIPLKIRIELDNARKYHERHGRCLLCDILAAELEEGERIVYENETFVAFLPFFASWPFEVHVYPRRHVQWLTQLNDKEVSGMADVLRKVTAAYNVLSHRLSEKTMPYIMAIHQAPVKGEWPFYHLHIEFYPALRNDGKQKFAAGFEQGTWSFTYDVVPEENARILREALEEAIKEGKVR